MRPGPVRLFRFAAGIFIGTLVWCSSTARAQYGQEQLIDSGPGPVNALHAADLDGDGRLDIIVCRATNTPALAWYRNLGGGQFGPAQPFPQQPTSATEALTIDVGNDGDLDVVAAVADFASPSGTQYRVDLYVNQGAGNFAAPITIFPSGGSVAHMEVADLEGDGDLDLFIGRGVSVQVAVFQFGSYFPQALDITHSASGLRDFRLGDVDGDLDTDMIVAAPSLGQVQWFDNVGMLSPFGGPHPIDSTLPGASSVDIADLDNDGALDVVAAGTPGSGNEVRWYKKIAGGPFGPPQLITSTGVPLRALCTDVDGDGDRDVVVQEQNGAAWYANGGQGNFGGRQVITSGTGTSKAMILADVDGDGSSDVVLGSDLAGGGGRIAWFRNVNQTLVSFCAGDGLGTPCPCGNSGLVGRGCASSIDPGGALLFANGAPSIANDTFVLVGTHMPNSSALYFQGTAQVFGGNGAMFGDGLRCVGGSITRLGAKTNVAGTSSYPTGGDVHISIKGGNAPGNVRDYQCWYRNAAPFCTASTFNLSNGLETTWVP